MSDLTQVVGRYYVIKMITILLQEEFIVQESIKSRFLLHILITMISDIKSLRLRYQIVRYFFHNGHFYYFHSCCYDHYNMYLDFMVIKIFFSKKVIK
jgi:hypothetical protein